MSISSSSSLFTSDGPTTTNTALGSSGKDAIASAATAAELPVKTGVGAMTLAETMFGEGVKIVSATYSGDVRSAGIYFSGETISPGVVPSDSGVILSTGKVIDFTNSSGLANQSGSVSTDTNGQNNLAAMNKIAGVATFDTAQFSAEFVPEGDTITMRLVFSSEEYPEWVNSGYNDAVGIWVNGVKVQLTVGDGNISIDNINANTNSNLYNDNTGGIYNTEMDGTTGVLTLKAPVNPGQVNSIVISIADAGDAIYDSNLMIVADSIQTALIANDDTLVVNDKGQAVLDLMTNDMTKGRTGVAITQINDEDVKIGSTLTLATGEKITINKDGTVTLVSTGESDKITFSYTITDDKGTADTAFVTIDAKFDKTIPMNAVDDEAIVTRKGLVTISLLTNDQTKDQTGVVITQIDGKAIVAGQTVTLAKGEMVTLNKDGTITFMATADTTTVDFDYTIGDDAGKSDKAKVTVYGDPVDGTAGNDQMAINYIDADGQMIDGRDGMAEVIMGYGGNDKITAGFGDDDIYGGTGHDFIRAGDGADIIFGGDGNDVLDGQLGDDSMNGGNGDDVFWIYDAGDIVTEAANGGYDKVRTNFDHTLTEHFEELWLNEGSGAVNATGNATDNKIVGNGNDNVIKGLGGNDRLFGEAGDDQMNGAAGDDRFWAGTGDDSVSGGDGADKVYGGGGNDTIQGGAGQDKLSGGAGDDEIWSGTGDDFLSGGTGADVFVFVAGNGLDRIKDFSDGVDHIQLSGLSFEKLDLVQTGNGVRVSYGADDIIMIRKMTLDTLDASDFLFG
jgi:Ca2+-binding RTX toxin-like protein